MWCHVYCTYINKTSFCTLHLKSPLFKSCSTQCCWYVNSICYHLLSKDFFSGFMLASNFMDNYSVRTVLKFIIKLDLINKWKNSSFEMNWIITYSLGVTVCIFKFGLWKINKIIQILPWSTTFKSLMTPNRQVLWFFTR